MRLRLIEVPLLAIAVICSCRIASAHSQHQSVIDGKHCQLVISQARKVHRYVEAPWGGGEANPRLVERINLTQSDDIKFANHPGVIGYGFIGSSARLTESERHGTRAELRGIHYSTPVDSEKVYQSLYVRPYFYATDSSFGFLGNVTLTAQSVVVVCDLI